MESWQETMINEIKVGQVVDSRYYWRRRVLSPIGTPVPLPDEPVRLVDGERVVTAHDGRFRGDWNLDRNTFARIAVEPQPEGGPQLNDPRRRGEHLRKVIRVLQ